MRVLVSGASGLVGRALVSRLKADGHIPIGLCRRDVPGTETVVWDPTGGTIAKGSVEGFDAVVHLAGDNISDGRWTAEKKRRIRDSRIQGTRFLCERLATTRQPPKVLVSASAVGFYGHRGDEVLDEDAPQGTGFLAGVCGEWEAATRPARDAGIRVGMVRFGAVLDPAGGMLGKLKRPFSLGLGGPLGAGRQWVSWIAMPDAVAAIVHILKTPELGGPVNLVSPNPITNAEFTAALARALGRRAPFRLPRTVARLALGEMADEVLFSSARARPEALLATGFAFRWPELAPALDALLRK